MHTPGSTSRRSSSSSSSSSDDNSIDVAPLQLRPFDAAKYMQSLGFVPGRGLGATLNGMPDPIEVKAWRGKSGLGASPDSEISCLADASGIYAEFTGEGGQQQPRAAQIRHALAYLERVKSVLEDPDFDVYEFHAEFTGSAADSALFDDLMLWQAVYSRLSALIRHHADNVVGPEVVSALAVAQQCFPTRVYKAVLAEKWWPRLAQAMATTATATATAAENRGSGNGSGNGNGNCTSTTKLRQVIDFVACDSHLLNPILPEFIFDLCSQIFTSADPELIRAVLPLPQFHSALPACVTGLQDVSRETYPILLPYLDLTGRYVDIPLRGNHLAELLLQAEFFKPSDNHYREILRAKVFPQWISELQNNLSGKVKDLTLIKEELLMIQKESFDTAGSDSSLLHEPLLSQALELINTFLDTGRVTPALSDENWTFSGVIDAYCAMNNYSHTPIGVEYGIIVGRASVPLKYFVKNDELYGVLPNHSPAPLRIQDIPNVVD